MNFIDCTIYHADSRIMPELEDESIDLIITSPPYWNIKDYGNPDQIGYGQSLEQYFIDLFSVWTECARILKPDRKICINIGDYFARTQDNTRHQIIPLHAEIINQFMILDFKYMGCVIWEKKTNLNPSGGGYFMGSYPYPYNGIVRQDHEYILIFQKYGQYQKIDENRKEQSRITKEEWKEYFQNIWPIRGKHQDKHIAEFPVEIPTRLVKMFSFVGDTILDPFMGSGTTAVAALVHNRNVIGYEIQQEYIKVIEERIRQLQNSLWGNNISFNIKSRSKKQLSDNKTQNCKYTPIVKIIHK